MRVIDDLQEVADLVSSGTPVFVRHSLGPDEDSLHPSRDYEADLELPGLPTTSLRPENWWRRDIIDWIARRVCKYLELSERDERRRPWLLTGSVVGYGPDHEPLIDDVEPIAWLGDRALSQARDIYARRFDVGRSSAG